MALHFVGGKPTKVNTATPQQQTEVVEEVVDQVKISQQQQPASITTEEAVSEVLTMVDEYTDLQRQIDAVDVAPLLKKQEALKKKLQSIAKSTNYPDDKPVRLCGTGGNWVQFSEKSNSTKISDKSGLIQAMGQDEFNQLAEVTLEKCKQVLSEVDLLKYTAQVPGSRMLKEVHYEPEQH